MIRVVFFASVREALGTDMLDEPHQDGDTISAILARLHGRGPVWHDTLGGDNLLVALNQEIVNPDAAVADGDEVAFFPPVTGG